MVTNEIELGPDMLAADEAFAMLEAFGCADISVKREAENTWLISARVPGIAMVAHSDRSKDTPRDPVYLAGQIIADITKIRDRSKSAKATPRAEIVEKLRKLLKEKAHAEVPRPIPDGGASTGDGVRSEPVAAADSPDPAGSGLGLASAQDQPTDQDGAANANAPVDAEFTEPEAPPEPPVDDSAGQAGGELPELDIGEADEPDFGGMVRDDRVAELSKQIDAIAKSRMAVAVALETNSREAMEEIESKHAGGLDLTEEEARIRRDVARARITVRTMTEIATDHKAALAKMTDEDLMALNPERLKWT